MLIHAIQAVQYQIREQIWEGRRHIVVPVVMMKEGVHSGSHGAILHTEEQLRDYTMAWNGIPVTVQHPERDGHYVQANEPSVLEQYKVGVIFNARYDDGLKAEAWLDVERLERISPSALAAIRGQRPLDVSVGVFNDEIPTEGEWEGETYVSIAENYRPDHLALLPGERGACSWEDGCGIRNNKKGGSMKDLLKTFKNLSAKGFVVSPIVNEMGFNEVANLLQAKLNSMDTDMRLYFLEDVFEDTFVYRVRNSETGDTTLYRRGYTANEGSVELSEEDPVEVRLKKEFVAVMKRTRKLEDENLINNVKQGGQDMSKDNLCCEGKVDALIANKLTQFTAADKEWLMTLKEEQIDRLSPVTPKEKKEEAPQVNKEEVLTEFKSGLKELADYTALMPEDMKSKVEAGLGMYEAKRKALVEKTLSVLGDAFTQEEVEAFSDEKLEKLSETKQVSDYSGMGAGGGNGEASQEEDPDLAVMVRSNNSPKKEED